MWLLVIRNFVHKFSKVDFTVPIGLQESHETLNVILAYWSDRLLQNIIQILRPDESVVFFVHKSELLDQILLFAWEYFSEEFGVYLIPIVNCFKSLPR